jgi:hypothetical protein
MITPPRIAPTTFQCSSKNSRASGNFAAATEITLVSNPNQIVLLFSGFFAIAYSPFRKFISPVPVSNSLSMDTFSPAQLVNANATPVPRINAAHRISLFALFIPHH